MLQKLLKTIKLFIRYLGTWIDPTFARFKFHLASNKPAWLDENILANLQSKYTPPVWNKYDESNISIRGNQRAGLLQKLLGNKINAFQDLLEVGCWDGMVSANLCASDRKVCAIDISDSGFQAEAFSTGVKLEKMDAADLRFENESFDFIYSFDAFEHFREPDKVFAEMSRVLKTNGYMYLSFGPLYLSPFGLHAESISVPYCQILFQENDMNKFIADHNLSQIDYQQVNGWTLQQYKALFDSYSSLKPCFYREVHEPTHLKLIAKYPTCFRNKSNYFNNFTVGAIEVMFQKKR